MKKMASLNFGKLLCLSLVAFCLQTYGQDVPSGQRLLSMKSFKLISRITTYDNNNDETSERQVVEEFYSNDQRRARISINDNEADKSRLDYCYDSTRLDLFVEHKRSSKDQLKCRQVKANSYLDRLLNGASIAEMENRANESRGQRWLRNLQPKVPGHIVGLARIAFWVESNRDDFRISASAPSTTLRNVPVEACELQLGHDRFPLPVDKVFAYYAEDAGRQDCSGLPMAVDIKRPDGTWVQLEFMNIIPMREDMDEMNSRMPLDEFAFPVGQDCAIEKEPKTHFSLVAELSFRMEILDYSDRSDAAAPAKISEQFIAYDGSIGFMRTDSFDHHAYSISVWDITKGIRYNIHHRSGANVLELDSRGNYRAGNMFERDFGEGKCTRTPPRKTFKSFFDFEKMVLMGRAKIRGVDCRAFEMITEELPITLFQPILSVTTNGSSRAAYEIDDETNGSNYNVVYYFAANPADKSQLFAEIRDISLGALMRVDIYLEGELLYHLDISEFSVGTLQDAPNGDRAEELFALRDRCTNSNHGALDFAKMNVELTLKIGPNLKSNAKEVAQILASSSLRNRAIVRALSTSARLVMTNVYDAESQIQRTDHDDELRLLFEAQATYPNPDTAWPIVIGYVLPTNTEWGFAASLIDCLLVSARPENGNKKFFVYCHHKCLIADRVNIEFSEDRKKIISFDKTLFDTIEDTKVDNQHCPLMMINTKQSTTVGEKELLRLSSWIHNELRGDTINFRLPVQGSKFIKIPATVNHVDISNDHWSASVGRLGGTAQLSAVEKDSVDGVGLTVASGQKYSSVKDDDGDELPMNHDHCHSICSSQPNCRSFSICLRSSGTECITSELDFREAKLLEQIEAERAKLTARTEKRKFSVSQDDKQVELLFDLRCKVHKKNALEMFHKIDSSPLDLKNSTIVAVDSLEKCAELCWQNNLEFFSRMDNIVAELGDGGKSDEEKARHTRDEWATHRINWCPRFFYLNLAYSSDFEWIKAQTGEEGWDKAGACAPIKPFAYQSRHDHPSEHHVNPMKTDTMPVFTKYEFVYLSLYVPEYGRRIVENSQALIDGRQLKWFVGDVEYCANACFMQTQKLVPQCKSFDFIEAKAETTRDMYRYCILHSNTIEDLELSGASNMIENLQRSTNHFRDPSAVRVWHYEPKLHAMSSAMVVRGTLNKISSTTSEYSSSFRVHGFGICVLLLASVVCTAVIVRLKGDKLVDLVSKPRRGSISSIRASLNDLD